MVPAYAQAPFLDNIEPHHLIKPKSLLASTYDDFIFANLDYGITQEDYDDVSCTLACCFDYVFDVYLVNS